MNKKAVMSLTDTMFFDTDCLSAFLWVNNQSLLAQLYPGKIMIPAEVYAELSIPSIPHLKNSQTVASIRNGNTETVSRGNISGEVTLGSNCGKLL